MPRFATCTSPIINLICPPPPPQKKRFCKTFVFHFSFLVGIKAVSRGIEIGLCKIWGGGANKYRMSYGRCAVAYTVNPNVPSLR